MTTYCFYPGRHKDFLVANAIFRMGGAAMLMTNKPQLYSRCKYELQHSERVHTGQDDTSYRRVPPTRSRAPAACLGTCAAASAAPRSRWPAASGP